MCHISFPGVSSIGGASSGVPSLQANVHTPVQNDVTPLSSRMVILDCGVIWLISNSTLAVCVHVSVNACLSRVYPASHPVMAGIMPYSRYRSGKLENEGKTGFIFASYQDRNIHVSLAKQCNICFCA